MMGDIQSNLCVTGSALQIARQGHFDIYHLDKLGNLQTDAHLSFVRYGEVNCLKSVPLYRQDKTLSHFIFASSRALKKSLNWVKQGQLKVLIFYYSKLRSVTSAWKIHRQLHQSKPWPFVIKQCFSLQCHDIHLLSHSCVKTSNC